MNRARACVKKQRPVWWTPEGVLERLESGQFIMVVCQIAIDEMKHAGIEISASRLRAEVTGWAESASWGPQLTAALKVWKKGSAGEMVLTKSWHDDFLAAMELEECSGRSELAAKYAGVSYGVVLAVLDSRNKCYDAEFAEKFRIAELHRVGVIRSNYMNLAETGEGKMAVRAQERIIEAALPGLHSQKQEVHVSGEVDHKHTHGITAGLAQAVVMASQNRIRKLNAGRQDLLPADSGEGEGMGEGMESRVIDVTPKKVQVRT